MSGDEAAAPPPLDRAAGRLARLRALAASGDLDHVIVHTGEAFQHVTGLEPPHGWPAAVRADRESSEAFYFAREEADLPVDRATVQPGVRATGPVDHAAVLAGLIAPALAPAGTAGGARGARGRHARARRPRVGLDRRRAPGWLLAAVEGAGAEVVDTADALAALRRRKDADEVALVRWILRLAEAAYRRAAAVIAPGASELDVYRAMGEVVERAAGTAVHYEGDFACGPGGGERGGPPSSRRLEHGEAFVIDFQIRHGGYWTDLCRTFAVGEPPAALVEALDLCADGLEAAEARLAPGAAATAVDAAVRDRLGTRPDLGGGGYFHVTGHGVGLSLHEPPYLAADSRARLEAGDVVAVEPGLYAPTLRGGVRTEDMYLVTAGGCERLSHLERGVWAAAG